MVLPKTSVRITSLGAGLTVTFAVSGFFLIQPTMMGELYAAAGALAILCAIVVALATQTTHFSRVNLGDLLRITVLNSLWLYLFFVTAAMGAGRWDFVLKAWSVQAIVCGFVAICLSAPRLGRAFLLSMFHVLTVLSLSSMATAALLFALGPDFGIVGAFDYGYTDPQIIYLPLSSIYNWILYPPYILPRFSMWFREAGIASIFLIWGAVIGVYFRQNRIQIVVLLLGCLFTLSTVGIASAVYAAALLLSRYGKFGFLGNAVVLIIAVAGGTALIMDAPVVGLTDKSNTALASIADRDWAVQSSMVGMWSNIFGLGMYRNVGLALDVSLVAAIDSIGLAGFVMFIMFYALGVVGAQSNWPLFMVYAVPAVITTLLSQPVFDAGFFTLLFLLPPWRVEPSEWLRSPG